MHPFQWAATAPDRIAIRMGISGETLGYAEFADRIRRIQNAFRAEGLRPGDVVAILCDNVIDFLPFVWAAQSSGLYYTPVNFHLTADEAAYIVNDCGATVLLTSDHLRPLVEQLTPELIPGVSGRWIVGQAVDGWRSLDEIYRSFPNTPIEDELEGDLFLYSSGTTGRPKGIRRPLVLAPLGESDSVNVVSFLHAVGVRDGSVFLSPAPLYHSAPIGMTMGIGRVGGTAVVLEKFDAQLCLQLIDELRITCTSMVPTMFVRLLKLDDDVRARYDTSSLVSVMHGAAPCPPKVKYAMIEWLGPILDEYYSSSEGAGSTYLTSQDWLTHPGSVGRPTLGVPHVLDEDGNELEAGQIGTIWFEGSSDFQYHGNATETAKTRNDRGWASVGDIGYLDADGYLYLSDRKAFMIISGGVNIYPQEVENALITHPAVMDVAVFGVPNEEFGEEVKAVVQPRHWNDRGPDLAAELTTWCRERIAGYKIPRSIDFMESLPRQDTGKLYKRLLRDAYWNATPAAH